MVDPSPIALINAFLQVSIVDFHIQENMTPLNYLISVLSAAVRTNSMNPYDDHLIDRFENMIVKFVIYDDLL